MDEFVNNTTAIINKRHVLETGFNVDLCLAAILEHCDRTKMTIIADNRNTGKSGLINFLAT